MSLQPSQPCYRTRFAHGAARAFLPRVAGATVLALAGVIGAAQAQPASALRVLEITEATHPYSIWSCARQAVKVRMLGQAMEVVVDGESRILQRAISASGARYTAPGDDTTWFWSKGGLANLSWSGAELPLCAEDGTLVTPLRASGNEPFWAVDYDGWQVTLSRPGEPPRLFEIEGREPLADGWRLQSAQGAENLSIDVVPALCVDNMSGLPRPYTVTLNMNEQTMHGCGGEPARLLQGVRWELKAVGGQDVTVPAWLEFLPDNRLAGSNGCNRLMGSYAVSGEGISFSQLGSTRMACPADIMRQADIVDQALTGARGFSFDEQGALLLLSDAGELRLVAEERHLLR